MRLEADRRQFTLPVIGTMRSTETRRLERLLAKGRARILSMTLSEQGGHGGRLFVSVQTLVFQPPRLPSEPAARCGVDLGIGQEWAVIAHGDDSIQRVPIPPPGSRSTSSAAGSHGSGPAGSSAPEGTARRTPS
jgi:putative transposase